MLLLILVLLLAQCKSEPKIEQTWNRTGNELVMRLSAEPSGLNPILNITDPSATQVMRHIFMYLMVINPQSGQLEPSLLAGEPTVEPADGGGLRYQFEIRDEASWDDGSPVTANDFAFSLKSVFNPRLPTQRIRPYLELIREVAVDPANPKKFSVVTKETYILALEAIVSAIPVLPAYLYDPEGLMRDIPLASLLDPAEAKKLEGDARLQSFADRFTSERTARDPGSVLGCGAYSLESIAEDQRITLVKKKDWWGDKLKSPPSSLLAYPDKLVYWPVRDNAAAISLVKSEELDVAVGIDAKDFLDLKADQNAAGAYHFFTPPMLTYYFIYVNTKNPKLSDKRVRQALAHLLNVEEIIQTVFFGMGERLNGPVLPIKDFHNKDLSPIPYNIERAKILLSEAGWTDSNNNGTVDKVVNGVRTEMKLAYLISNVPAQEKIALIFKDAASQAGIDLEVISKEFQAQRADLNARNYELASGALTAQPSLEDFYQVWHTDSDTPDGTNRTSFGNAQSDDLIETIRKTLDKTERDRLYRLFQAMVYEEQPMLFLLTPQSRILVHKRFDAFAASVPPGFFPNQYRLADTKR
jgi:peptide/nickel transport system substrate-binding protein